MGKFHPRHASSLVEIPISLVRFPYPTWTLMMDCYILAQLWQLKHVTVKRDCCEVICGVPTAMQAHGMETNRKETLFKISS